MTQRLGWGIIGVGRRAREVMIPALLASPSSRVAGVCGRDPKSAEAAAGSWAELKVYPDPATLLADPEVQVVYIATPHFLHVPQAVQCLEAGRHVFTESPLALSGDGAHKLIEKAKARSLKLGVAFQYRYHSALQELSRLIGQGELGEIRHLSVRLAEPITWPSGWWLDSFRTGPAALIRFGVPGLDLAFWLKGAEVSEVSALGSDQENPPVNAHVSVLLSFQDRSQAFVLGAANFHEPEHSIQIEGARGRARLEGDFTGQGPVFLSVTKGNEETVREFEPEDPVGQMLDAFARAVTTVADFSPDGPCGKKVVELTCAVIESLKSKRAVKLGEMHRAT